MKYYKFMKDDVILSYGMIDGEISSNCTEITKEEYDTIIKEQADIDDAAKKKREEEAEVERKKREEEAAKHKALIDDYVAKIKAGTITIDDVPDEYKSEVKSIVDPTPTNEELKVSLSNAQDAINFLLENGLANGGVS